MKQADRDIIALLQQIAAGGGGGGLDPGNDYETVVNKVTDLTNPDNTKYPTTLAVANAIAEIPAPTGGVIGQAFFDGTGHAVENLVLPTGSVISGVSYIVDGEYAVAFTPAQPDLNYQIVPTLTRSGTPAVNPTFFDVGDKSVGGFTVHVMDSTFVPAQVAGIEISILRQSQ